MSPYLSVLVPSYNQPTFLLATLESLLSDGIDDMEVIVCDDASTVDLSWVTRRLPDARLKWFYHTTNLGYGGNLSRALSYASGTIVMLLGQDDLVLPGAIKKSLAPFDDPSTAVVTRPYYWFMGSPDKPCRVVYPLDPKNDTCVTLDSPCGELKAVFWSIAQLSGLLFRREYLRGGFHADIFTAHVWPFLEAMKAGHCISLSDFTIAVRIESSMTRSSASTYQKSSLQSWIDVFNGTLDSPAWQAARRCALRYLTESSNFVGLVQIRCTAGWRPVVDEIDRYISLRRGSLVNPQFLLFASLSLCLPPRALRLLADGYKSRIMGTLVKHRLTRMGVIE